MRPNPRESRILAIDLRLGRFGYAVFAGPDRLLDWGVSRYGLSGGAAAARRRLALLLKQFLPATVVVTTATTEMNLGAHGVGRILTAIRSEAASRTVPLQTIEKSKVKETFRSLHAKTKHETATVVARLFPELRWKLPPKRKLWQKEHYRIAIFEAVAVGYVYWQQVNNCSAL